jgi:hypothetical protein
MDDEMIQFSFPSMAWYSKQQQPGPGQIKDNYPSSSIKKETVNRVSSA